MRAILIIGLLAFTTGCSNDEAARQRVSVLEVRVLALEEKLKKAVADSEEKNKALLDWSAAYAKETNADIAELRRKVLTKMEAEEPAVLSPSSKGFSVSRNAYGVFPISVENAQPYLDGHKLTFEVGNLSSATVTGGRLEITYGAREPDFPDLEGLASSEERLKALKEYQTRSDANKKARRTTNVSVERDLLSGVWTVIEVVIAPSKPEDLGRMEVMVKATGVKMSVGKK